MGRKPAPEPLPLPLSNTVGAGFRQARQTSDTREVTSPDSRSPMSSKSPSSPLRSSPNKAAGFEGTQPMHVADLVQQLPEQEPEHPPTSQAMHQPRGDRDPSQQQPKQQQANQRHGHEPSQSQSQSQSKSRAQHRHGEEKSSRSGFFSHFGKSSKNPDRLQNHQHSGSRSDMMSRGNDQQSLSSPASKFSEPATSEQQLHTYPSRSDVSGASSTEPDQAAQARKGKPKPFALLNRSKSIHDNEATITSPKEPPAVQITEPDRGHNQAPLNTAPLGPPDRSFREMMSSTARNHSADRAPPRDHSGHRDGGRDSHRQNQSSLRENGGSFFGGLKHSSRSAADIISKGLFGKGSRSGSATEREPIIDDEHYVLKVITLPLVEQTRRTRISKKLEDSRDKTEFWMPSFPWRAIDYLNYKGTDVEGLYRVPGSGPQIKKWQRKFDEELDVDLFAQDDLYDINIIGSMLKAWLRQLPDELFPKEAQERIARECVGAETVPQLLIDELSNLSPFNYYLLFAITCHLSLLLAHSDKNKMDFRNLCICFQPCMKIDAFSFRFLVCDWRECWKGCKQEAKFIEEEYMLLNQPPPTGMSASRQHSGSVTQGSRNVSPAGSSRPANAEPSTGQPLKKKNLPNEQDSTASTSTISTNLTVENPQATSATGSGDLRPLSPIKPLSPLGF